MRVDCQNIPQRPIDTARWLGQLQGDIRLADRDVGNEASDKEIQAAIAKLRQAEGLLQIGVETPWFEDIEIEANLLSALCQWIPLAEQALQQLRTQLPPSIQARSGISEASRGALLVDLEGEAPSYDISEFSQWLETLPSDPLDRIVILGRELELARQLMEKKQQDISAVIAEAEGVLAECQALISTFKDMIERRVPNPLPPIFEW